MPKAKTYTNDSVIADLARAAGLIGQMTGTNAEDWSKQQVAFYEALVKALPK